MAVDPLTAGLFAVGQFATAVSQGKMTREQAALQARRLGLDEKQLDFMISQAERGNRIADHNVGQVSPLLQTMVGRQEGIMSQSPEYTRLEPPSVNNPYGAGGAFGNQAPPKLDIPGMSNDGGPEIQDPTRSHAGGPPRIGPGGPPPMPQDATAAGPKLVPGGMEKPMKSGPQGKDPKQLAKMAAMMAAMGQR